MTDTEHNDQTPAVDAGCVEKLFADETAAAVDAEHDAVDTCRDAADWLNEPDEPDDPLVHELIECGEMVAIVGQSKAGKSFITLQLAVCIAMGLPFLGRAVERRRVYIANLEVSRKQYKKRLRKLCSALQISPDDLHGWLFIDNMKGETASWQWCHDAAVRHECAAVIIDPFYQIFHGDESDVAACNDAIAQMKAFQKDGITVIVVFHSPKGFSGDRQLIDMISGSSILARFPESIIGLLNHAVHKQCRVVKCVLRNYAPPEDATIEFTDGMYTPADDVAPIVETANNRRTGETKRQVETTVEPLVLELLRETGKAWSIGTLVTDVRKLCDERNGFTPGEKTTTNAIKAMAEHRKVVISERAHTRGGAKMVSLPPPIGEYDRPEYGNGGNS